MPEALDDDIEPVRERNEDDPLKSTYAETLMQQVGNIGAKRERKPPRRLIEEIPNYAEHLVMTESLTSESGEPNSPSEALNGEHSDQWKEAMDSEYCSLLKNENQYHHLKERTSLVHCGF